MEFSYKARTKEGKLESGTIEAYSKEAAAALLQKYNIFVTSVQEKKSRESFLKGLELSKKVSRKDLAIFFRQLSLMLESRVPVVQSLYSLALETKKPSFKSAIQRISNLVEEGIPLSEAFSRYPDIFGNFYINLIKSGEASGKISQALYHVSEHLESESDIIAQVRQAMVYPVFVITVLFVVLSIIITRLVPRISDLIEETQVTPPFFTMLALSFYEFLEGYWWTLVLGLFLIVIFSIYYVRTSYGKKNFDKVSLKVPVINTFFKQIFLVRFCTNVSTLLIAGISINKTLEITEDTVNNKIYKDVITDIGKRVSEGEKISAAMLKHGEYFPLFVIQMVKVGEETGKLDKVLQEVVSFYQKEINRSINLFSSLLEPIIIIILGLFVTLLAVSVFSPIYSTIINL